jgi:hypothetical protein
MNGLKRAHSLLPVSIMSHATLENCVLRRIFGAKTDGVTGGWRILPNEELHDLYSSPSIIRIIMSMRMRCAGNGGEEERL